MDRKLKVLMLNGSPRENDNIALAFHEMEQVFAENGVEYENILLGRQVIRGCIACETCRKTHRCVFPDLVNELAVKFEAADGLVIARRSGCTVAFDELNKFFTLANMPVATSNYWNNIYGWDPGEGAVDAEGRQVIRLLARNMVFLMKSIVLGKAELGAPALGEQRVWTNFTR